MGAVRRRGRGCKLDYLVNLGVNVIQIMPADEFAGGSSCGYNPAFTNQASDDAWTSTDAADGMGFSASFGLGPYALIVLSQDQ